MTYKINLISLLYILNRQLNLAIYNGMGSIIWDKFQEQEWKYVITGSDISVADLSLKATAYYPCKNPKGA